MRILPLLLLVVPVVAWGENTPEVQIPPEEAPAETPAETPAEIPAEIPAEEATPPGGEVLNEAPEEELPETPEETLPETPGYSSVVTAKRPEQTEFNSTLSVNIIDRQRLQELQPRTIAEALRNQPGVFVQQTGFMGGAPIIRGFMGRNVVYLFDGVRRNTASIYAGPNNYLNNVDPFTLQRVEIIRGPGSVLYGSDAIGGVVNVISAMPLNFAETELEPFARAGLTFESADAGWLAGIQGGFHSPDVMFNIGLSHMSAGHVRGGSGDGILAPSAFNQGAFSGQAAFKLSSTDSLEVLAQHFRRPKGTRFDTPNRIQSNEREMALLRYVGKRKGPFDTLQASAYYHRQYDFTDDRNWDTKSVEHSFGADLQARSRIGPVNLTYGLHYHRDVMGAKDAQNHTQEPDATWDNPAAFLIAEWLLGSRVTLEGSIRGDYFVFNSSPPPAGASVPPGLLPHHLSLSRDDFALTGGLGAVVKITDSLNWVLSGGTAFRAPNKNDYLSVGEFTMGYSVPPSATLKPERSFSVETGLRAQSPRVVASFAVFYTYMKELLVRTPASFEGSDTIAVGDKFLNVYAPQNVDSAQVAGTELSLRVWLTEQLSVYGNGSWMWGQRSDGEPLDHAYPANGTLGVRFQNQREQPRYFAEAELFGIVPFGRIPSDLKTSDPAYWFNPQDRNQGSLLVNGRLPGFVLLNFRAGARLCEWMDMVVDLENLTNKKYRMKNSRINGPGFNARVGLTVRY